jgi:hypothetical protein
VRADAVQFGEEVVVTDPVGVEIEGAASYVLQRRCFFGWWAGPGWVAGHSFARWCWHGVVRQVVRLGEINQEDDRAVAGQTTNDLRPA